MWARLLCIAVKAAIVSGTIRGHGAALSLRSSASATNPPVAAAIDLPFAALAGASVRGADGVRSSEVDGVHKVGHAMLRTMEVGADSLGGTLVMAACVLFLVPLLLGTAAVLTHYPGPGVARENARVPAKDEADIDNSPRGPPHVAASPVHRSPRPDLRLPNPLPTAPPWEVAPQPPPRSPLSRQSGPSRLAKPVPPEDSDSSGHGPAPLRSDISTNSAGTTGTWSGPLCPGLVVRQPGGVTLSMVGLCAPYEQNEIIDFKRADGTRDVVARAVLSEITKGGGIVLESALRLPIAFLNTEHAVGPRDGEPPRDRYITVSQSSLHLPSTSDASTPPLYCTLRADGAGEGFIMWRGAGVGQTMVLAVRVHGDGRIANIVDGDGKLLAATEARGQEPGARQLRLLHIASGVDAGLIMLAVIAAQKLR